MHPAMIFVDSHAHLADPQFDADRDEVVARARAAGAVAILCVGESIDAAARAEAIASRYPGFVYWSAGVHPHDAAMFDATSDLAAIGDHIARGAVAVGECGLDYHYDHSPRDAQRRAFSAQLALAKDLSRPVIVHTREAEDDTAAMVQEAGRSSIAGVLHSFTGSISLARIGLEAGWHVSFSGIITFKSWTDLDLLRLVPDDRLLVETDAPYLTPVPNRSTRRNEPAFAAHTLARLADVRGVDAGVLGTIVTENARRLFALPAA
ncbi:MAG: TatD family hydrolase [Gemmatimonadota bacterium]|nr:TatD family hydrolase [Gemmatimonadota bacterium]